MIQRGEIYYADLGTTTGSEQGGLRPVLILQNNVGNRYSPTTIVATITSRTKKGNMPTHITLHKSNTNGLKCDSMVALEQIRTIDKQRLKDKIGIVSETESLQIQNALKISLAMMA